MPTLSNARAVIVDQISEKEWQGWVALTARTFGWRAYHTLRSDGSEAGFPDLVLVKPPRLIVAELKRERGKTTAAQDAWLADFIACDVETYLWRPSQQDEVIEILRRRA